MVSQRGQRRSRSSSKSNPVARAAACVFESVEGRRMMSVALQMGVLSINGTSGNDKIVVEQLSNGRIRVTDNGKVSSFKIGNVKRITATLGAGNDSYTGKSATKSQSVFGGEGNDLIMGGRKADEISGEAGDDRVFGNEGNDTLKGFAGRDELAGGNGDDLLDGGDDNDMLWGNLGADLHIGGAGEDDARYDDEILGFGIAGRSSGIYAALPVAGSTSAANVSYNNGASGEGDRIIGDVESIVGTERGDTLIGNDVGNYLAGNGGADWIDGRAGMDGLDGGAGADVIYGGADSDVLMGKDNAFTDYLDGGAGRDTLEVDRDEILVSVDGVFRIDTNVNGEVLR
jgi:Ca2+-binding RTX toxin-like protein